MASVELAIELHVLEFRTGYWCPACLLPSGVEADVAFVNARTLRVMDRRTVVVCDECRSQTWRSAA